MNNERELISNLIDLYGTLLTNHQLNILQDYYFLDLSMNEIAENNNVSKAAISDIIKRSIKQLNSYEKNLKLIELFSKLSIITKELEEENITICQTYANKLKRLIGR